MAWTDFKEQKTVMYYNLGAGSWQVTITTYFSYMMKEAGCSVAVRLKVRVRVRVWVWVRVRVKVRVRVRVRVRVQITNTEFPGAAARSI